MWHTWDDAEVQLPVDGIDPLDRVVLVLARLGDDLWALPRAFAIVTHRRWGLGLICLSGHTATVKQWERVLSVFLQAVSTRTSRL